MLKKTIIREPDMIEVVLVGILAVWTICSILLIKQAIGMQAFTLLSWTSLTTFFVGFSSIVLLVIAIILADMRKEMARR